MFTEQEFQQAVQEVEENAQLEIQDCLSIIDEYQKQINPQLGIENKEVIELSIYLENLKIDSIKKSLSVQQEGLDLTLKAQNQEQVDEIEQKTQRKLHQIQIQQQKDSNLAQFQQSEKSYQRQIEELKSNQNNSKQIEQLQNDLVAMKKNYEQEIQFLESQ